ncbi:helicase HerA-like domain-containing protein [Salana multivorans]
MTVPTPEELARLRAEAAAAEAAAAQAKADAARAALAAAEAAAAASSSTVTSSTVTTSTVATPEAAEPAAPTEQESVSDAAPAPEATEPSATPDATDAAEPAEVPEQTAESEAPPAAPAPASVDEPGADSEGELTGYPAEVAAKYSFPATLPLGALLVDGTPEPRAQVGLAVAMLNRHGLVAGATGTGKTRTLQVMAEGVSAAGVPVFLADIKGDLSGLMKPGTSSEKLLARTTSLGQDWQARGFPVEFYTLGGLGTGVPIRTTVTDFGPLLLAKVLGLNATQESSLGLIFHWADTQGLALLDLKDLQATIAYLTSDEGKAELKGIGGVSTATAGVILREIVSLQAQGADAFFGEPAFTVAELLRVAPDGRGVISALELPAVADRPALFSTFLMWLLAELYSELPEVGDQDKPKLVFFFDEAHLLFNDASKDFLQQVVQTVRLIRSKGVGVFFITQVPQDVPADVLAQLGNRVQHALRAFTPQDASALRAAVRTYPTSPYNLESLLTSLGTGEAVVTVMSEKGAPTPVAWTRMRAPEASMEPASEGPMKALVAGSPLQARYGSPIDSESAYEILQRRFAEQQALQEAEAARVAAEKAAAEHAKEAEKAARAAEKEAKERAKEMERMRKELERDARASESRSRSTSSSRSRSSGGSALDNFLKSAGTQLGREITRSIFGTRRR